MLLSGGPAVQVSAETGIKIPATSPQQAVRDLGAALVELAGNPGLRSRLAASGRTRVLESFTWRRKFELVAEEI